MIDEQFTIRIPCPTIYAERTTFGVGLPPEGVTTHNVPCGGNLRPCPICRAVRYCGREGHCLDSGAVTHVVKRHFQIEDENYGIEGGVPGWTRGERWNGWQCPRFEKAAALAVLAKQDEMGGRAEYDEATDTMLVWMDPDAGFGDEQPDRYPGERLETPEGVKTVYAVGAWAWIWDAVED